MRDLETQRRQLIDIDKNLEDSNDNQSPYTTPTASDNSDINFISEASEDSLSAPSDTKLFDLRAKSLSPKPISLEPSSSSNSATSPKTVVKSLASESSASPPSSFLSTLYVLSSRFNSDNWFQQSASGCRRSLRSLQRWKFSLDLYRHPWIQRQLLQIKGRYHRLVDIQQSYTIQRRH